MKAFIATLTFPIALCAMLGGVAWTIAEAPGVKLPRKIAKTAPVKRVEEWTVGKEIAYQEKSCGLPKGALAALIEHETGGTWDERSYNPERKSSCYRRARNEREKGRCASRGLTQTVARWHLRSSDDPRILDNPILSVRYGGAKLCSEFKRARGNLRRAYYRYNGTGKDAEKYAAKVMNEFKYFSRMS